MVQTRRNYKTKEEVDTPRERKSRNGAAGGRGRHHAQQEKQVVGTVKKINGPRRENGHLSQKLSDRKE